MGILLWVAVVIVAANILFGSLLLVRFRAEEQRTADARHRGHRVPHWRAG